MLLNATTFTIGLLYAAYLWQRHGSAAARAAITANLLLGIPQIIGYHARTLAETADLLDRTITYGD